jgi:hypothetical protein
MRRLAGVLLIVAVAGCTGDGPGLGLGTPPEPTTTSSPVTSTVPPVVECPGAGEFEEGSGIAVVDGEGSDSVSLGHISWEISDQCETFVFEFETAEGAPATTVPDVAVSHLESFQVIRLSLGVTSTVVSDQLVETALVDRLYVVRAFDGGMFVDLHLSAPAAARARVDASPARLTIDLRPGFVEFEGASVTGEQVVVVSPGTGASVDPVTRVMGYVRSEQPAIALTVTQEGAVVTETGTVAVETGGGGWGEFSHELGLPPGNISVQVGVASQDDDGPEQVTLDLAVS